MVTQKLTTAMFPSTTVVYSKLTTWFVLHAKHYVCNNKKQKNFEVHELLGWKK